MLFLIGYFVLYVFCGVNLGFVLFVMYEFGLLVVDFGFFISFYFFGFVGV